MNLVQKLPIGLSLACMVMLSSCSNEDLQVATPEKQITVTDRNLRQGDNGITLLPQFFPTIGATGSNSIPSGWARKTDDGYSGDTQALPIGLSSLNFLWGNPTKFWIKPLMQFPNTPNSGSILTISTATDLPSEKNKRSAAMTKIKNLKPGKVYKIKFYLATSIPKSSGSIVKIPTLAEVVLLRLKNAIDVGPYASPSGTDNPTLIFGLSASQTYWQEKVLTLKATANEAELSISALTKEPGQYAYAHIFVDENAVVQID